VLLTWPAGFSGTPRIWLILPLLLPKHLVEQGYTANYRDDGGHMIDTRLHGIIDYVTGALLILAPYIFGFANGGIEQWLPQTLGAMILVMSLLTNYELSVSKLIPLKVHLAVDIMGGAVLAVSPWAFGFANLIWWPHLLVGLMEIVVALATKRDSKLGIYVRGSAE
jgi:hypothetical protein